MRVKRKWPCAWAVIVGGAFVGAGCTRQSESAGAEPPAAAQPAAPERSAADVPEDAWVAVRTDTLRQLVPAVGSLRARQTTRLGAQVSGRVAAVLVDVGDRVVRGQVLVRLDPSFFDIEVQQQEGALKAVEGALAAREADVTYWTRELARQEGLFEKGAGSPKELDDARTAHERAVADRNEQQGKLAEAQKRLAYSRERLAETEIRAPYDGVVTARMVDPGNMVSSTPVTELLEVREVDVLYLEFSLPQEHLSSVRTGTPIEFDVEGVTGDPMCGDVAVIFPAIDEATRSFRCRAVIANKDRRLQPGALARVRVIEKQVADALVVPRSSLAQTTDGWQVFVSNAGRPVPRAVQVGLMTDDAVEVSRGLAAGEFVLASADRAR